MKMIVWKAPPILRPVLRRLFGTRKPDSPKPKN